MNSCTSYYLLQWRFGGQNVIRLAAFGPSLSSIVTLMLWLLDFFCQIFFLLKPPYYPILYSSVSDIIFHWLFSQDGVTLGDSCGHWPLCACQPAALAQSRKKCFPQLIAQYECQNKRSVPMPYLSCHTNINSAGCRSCKPEVIIKKWSWLE